MRKSPLFLALLTAPTAALAVESIHFGYIDASPALTDSLRLPTRDGTLWWSANKQRYNVEDNSPVAYSYHDGYVENSFLINGATHTAAEAAARWRSVMTGNGDPWTGVSGAQIGTPGIIILDELVSSFTDGGDGTLLRSALQTYLAYPGATRNDIAAFLSPGFCQSTSIVKSNYDDLIYSANNYLRSIQLELYATQANFNSGGDTYLASQLGAPLRKWTTTFGVAASRVQPTLLVSNFAGADTQSYNAFLNRQFQFMANGWYTSAHAVDSNVSAALRNGVSSYTWSVGANDYQLLSTITTRDAYFEEFLNWYSVLGKTTLDNFWVADVNASWSTAGSWLTSSAPGGVDAYAKFIFPITQPRSVNLASTITAGHLVFDNLNTYTLSGGGALSMQVSSGSADVTVTRGSHTITVPLTLTSNTTFAISPADSTLTLNAQMSGSGSITKTGAGTLALKNARTATLDIQGGAVQVMADGTNSGTSKLNTLTITSGKLDLKNNALVLVNTAPGGWNGSEYTGVTGTIAAGRNHGAWNGNGIVTSMSNAAGASGLTTLAIAANSVLNKTTFAGQSVDSTDLLVMYTYAGDANLSGNVDGDDYFRIDAGYSAAATGWINGDFNYDGRIDADDYFLIDRAYSRQGSALGGVSAGGVSAIPEPGALALILPALVLSTRRRRQA